jgi:hypothetical protein
MQAGKADKQPPTHATGLIGNMMMMMMTHATGDTAHALHACINNTAHADSYA